MGVERWEAGDVELTDESITIRLSPMPKSVY